MVIWFQIKEGWNVIPAVANRNIRMNQSNLSNRGVDFHG
ncbi:Unknown protein sequence [Pseudomonas amygdali pv. lachrymans]|uniref:Uncharacterized protein n=1 Tax=Pseudomonas amygdali pv. lachrymans TaxID=53707 RepID=A0ABR5KRS2_PSEAV|nr:Unknown protein sequence [Pseudomonas amygdali pv. lachrymans]